MVVEMRRRRTRSRSRRSIKDVRNLVDDHNRTVIDVCQSFELIADSPKLFGAGYEPSRIVLVSCSEGSGDGIDNDESDGEGRSSREGSTAWYWCIVVHWGGRDFVGERSGVQSFDVSGDEEGEQRFEAFDVLGFFGVDVVH